MKVTELIIKMKNDSELNLEDALEIRNYIPIIEKQKIIKEIIDKSSNIDEGFFNIDSVKKRICFEVAMIKYHTNLDINEEDYDYLFDIIIDDLDLYTILTSCYKKDYYECADILRLVINDIKNQYSIESSIVQLCNNISNRINKISESINNEIENFDINKILPKDINTDDLKVLLEKYVK